MSTIAMSNISETVTDRGLVPKEHNRKWHMGYQMVTRPMTSRDPQRCCEAVRSAILATAWLLVFVCCLHALGCLIFVGFMFSISFMLLVACRQMSQVGPDEDVDAACLRSCLFWGISSVIGAKDGQPMLACCTPSVSVCSKNF